MKVVLDASAAMEIVAERGRARQFLEEIDRSDSVLAPDLFVAEVVNAESALANLPAEAHDEEDSLHQRRNEEHDPTWNAKNKTEKREIMMGDCG